MVEVVVVANESRSNSDSSWRNKEPARNEEGGKTQRANIEKKSKEQGTMIHHIHRKKGWHGRAGGRGRRKGIRQVGVESEARNKKKGKKTGLATLGLLRLTLISWRINDYSLRSIRSKVGSSALLKCLFRTQSINLGQDGSEGLLHIAIVQSRSLDKTESIALGKGGSVVCGDGFQVLQIALISHEHDDDVCVGMVLEFFQPALNVVKRVLLGDVVDEKGAHSTAVVGGCDGSVALLAGGIPYLGLDYLALALN